MQIVKYYARKCALSQVRFSSALAAYARCVACDEIVASAQAQAVFVAQYNNPLDE